MKEKNKNRRVLIGSVSLASAIALVTMSIGPSLLFAQDEKVFYKDDSEKWDIIVPDNYKSIQEALDNANPGDRIFVKSGSYIASDSSIRKKISIDKEGLTIHGENKETTIINGVGFKNPVIIEANYVSISGFTFKNCKVNGSLIVINSDFCTINDNIFVGEDYRDGTEYCIIVNRGDENTISNNTIFGTDNGIEFRGCIGNVVENNIIMDNNDGIELEGIFVRDKKNNIKLSWRGCSRNIFLNNQFINNKNGVHCLSSYENFFLNNTFDTNKNSGIYLSDCTNEIVKYNRFIRTGLEISGNFVEFYFHEITGNTVNGKPLYYYKNENDITAPYDAGQIIIVECSNVVIEKVIISKTSTAVLIAFSVNVRIRNSEFSSNIQGIFLSYSTRNVIESNNFINNSNDAYFEVVGFFKSKSNKWRYNYWDSWLGTKRIIFRLTNKRIHGKFHLNTRFKIFDKFGLGYRTKNIDRFPRVTPYSINA